ncbi:porin-like protein [Novosphingobium kunmingense]|uniref:Porin-like protein n=1 Tax=Novosphingobium kunmingense TaxID=1211806 RepID=A0A2N0I2E8_9SPHN|nr:putative porin [Novosphingobium kunmingense]PKB25364.1 porin-like protein [Novosphingobium kunmingense]
MCSRNAIRFGRHARFRMMRLALAALMLAVPQAASAADRPAIDISGDVRLRLEQDWDSQTETGAKREERTRARFRARLRGKADLDGGFIARAQVRTTGQSQQSANITFADFDGNPEDDLKVLLDQYSVVWQRGSVGAEVGRMAFPFFTSNEYLWDNDVSVLGLSGNVSLPLPGSGKLKFNGGAFKLPVGPTQLSGKLFAGQAVLERGHIVLAAGLFRFDADRGDKDRLRLLDGNGGRDYAILSLNAQYKLRAASKPLVLGADLYRNLQGYRGALDSISRAHANRRTGYVLSAGWGDTSKPGRLEVGYRWFRMEKLAVNGSYAQDDTFRAGTGTDLKGHDIYANYAVTRVLTLGIRAAAVERLITREGGKRVRLDLTYRFN